MWPKTNGLEAVNAITVTRDKINAKTTIKMRFSLS